VKLWIVLGAIDWGDTYIMSIWDDEQKAFSEKLRLDELLEPDSDTFYWVSNCFNLNEAKD
jgi:hypothetical protein